MLTDDPVLVAPLVEQFDSVWRGDFCRNCERRDFCGDCPIDDLRLKSWRSNEQNLRSRGLVVIRPSARGFRLLRGGGEERGRGRETGR